MSAATVAPNDIVLGVDGLSCDARQASGTVRLLRDVRLTVRRSTTVGIVGESGAGKSMLVKAILGIAPAAIRVTGTVALDGEDLSRHTARQRARLIGRKVGTVFQNPMTSLNPFVRIGHQIEEASRLHLRLPPTVARRRAIALLTVVGIADPEDCYGYYPHQFSGGMKQRIMIAAALACEPLLLIADEATTALDVTVQKEILDLLQIIQQERQMSMVMVSHNLGVVAGRTDTTHVMYGGIVVEYGPTAEVFRNPRHRYTEALLSAMPRMDQPAHTRLRTIPGQPFNAATRPNGCPFAQRCPAAMAGCHDIMPATTAGADVSHGFACHDPLPEIARPPPIGSPHVR